ncbi:Protein ROOT HAIR DEFECTIVE 3 [Chlorella vulgaris]
MDRAAGGQVLQVVSGDGSFNTEGVDEFVKDTGVESSGVGYTVVAIMGPQSSGKSTLLNNLFGTRFEEMDALSGRNQTTHGIWLARSTKVAAPTTLVMDLEGSDGRERGEDDTSFERQSALFALAAADIVLVNMWAKDVGRESGAGKPLLKTIFQVNLKLFQPAPSRRRTVLLFVFRDRTKTPLEKLVDTWEGDLQRMWDSITKPPQYEDAALTDFFELQYAALSNYEDRAEDFLAETVLLRRRFTAGEGADESSFLRVSDEKLPGHALALSMAKVWEVVKEHRDLNLPAHRVMVANIRCGELMAEQLAAFKADAAWHALAEEAGADLAPAFGQRAADLMDSCLEGYDEEARYFEAGVSEARRADLVEALEALVRPAFEAQLALLRELALTVFKQQLQQEAAPGERFVDRAQRYSSEAMEQFDSQLSEVVVPDTEWDVAPARAQLQHDISAHVQTTRLEHVGRELAAAQKAAQRGVSSAAMSLFEAPPADLWPRLARVVAKASSKACAALVASVQGYGLEGAEVEGLYADVAAAARSQLLVHAHEAANTALSRLKDRFNQVFQRDEHGMPRTWQPSVDITAVTAAGRRAAAQLLSQLCFVRGDGEAPASAAVAAAEAAVQQLAEDGGGASGGTSGSTAAGAAAGGGGRRGGEAEASSFDLLSAAEWPGVGDEDVLLTPAQARSTWRQFMSDSTFSVQQALATQQANRAAQNRLPPLWAMAAMVVLGFNEFMAVLYNPLWLLFLLLAFLFARTVYLEMDVEAEMARGLLPGSIALSSKFMPAIRKVTRHTFDSAKTFLQDAPEESNTSNNNGNSNGGGGGVRRGGGAADAGLRSRRREVEMTDASHDTGTALHVGTEATTSSRKDN